MSDPQPFKADGWCIFKTLLLSSSGWPVWTTLALGIIFIAVGSIFDVRYLVIGLMVCIAIVPGIASLMYFSHTLSQHMVANMIPHTVEHTDDGYILHIWRREIEGTEETDSEGKNWRWVESSVIPLSKAKIIERRTTLEYELLYFKDSPLKILYLPI